MGEGTVPWWHFIHRYNQWSNLVVTKNGGGVQTKACVVCGKIKIRWP